jgi:hypothetical protein
MKHVLIVTAMLFAAVASANYIDRVGGVMGGSVPHAPRTTEEDTWKGGGEVFARRPADIGMMQATIDTVTSNAFTSTSWRWYGREWQHNQILIRGRDTSKLAVGERWDGWVKDGGIVKDATRQPIRQYFAVSPPVAPKPKQ